ncbi:MAG: hypothetical protein L6Q26_08965 [Anaerolineales bacterium]|nr:hypothetical protein [Anaerolineales bacterium]NUQ84302.1 hypothetical protein [Anaerolineales bacterium]
MRAQSSLGIWDILTLGVLALTACIAAYFALIFVNPNSSLNVLPPGGGLAPTLTSTPAPATLPPTWTASPTLEVSPTNTPVPTWTSIPTNTPFSLVPPTRTPRPSNTPRAPFTAISIQQVDSTIIHPELACNWAGIGGTVVDTNNSHVIGTVVVLRGTLNGSTVDLTTVTGINKEYGPSGYEFVLGDAPVASNKTLYVQLVDLNGIPLSDKVEIATSADCSKNLVLVRFKKNR